MNDQERLAGYVDVWWVAIDDFTKLLETIPSDQWTTETDLAGWDVRAIAAHTAHLESILAGAPEEVVEVGEPDHVTSLMGLYTEQGVVSRRDRSTDHLINEIRSAATSRHTALLADPPTDGAAKPPRIFGGIGWDWERLLRNRPLDVWMHEQDVRRAVDRPGNLDSAPAQHTADYLLESLAMVLGKRIAPPAGTSVVLDVSGSAPHAVEMGADGRAVEVPLPDQPTARLTMDRETFIVIAGGRRDPEPGAVAIEGDEVLAGSLLDMMAVTP